MNILNIKTFLNIVRYQSISGAAQAMFTSQPTISSRLNQLEEELGFQLVIRRKGHRTIELTEKGQSFISLAEHWMELDRQTMQFCQEGDREALCLVAPGSLQEYVVPQIAAMLMEGPNLPRLQFRTAGSTMVYQIVASREADVGLALRLVQQDGVIAIPVFNEENVLLCPADTVLPDREIRPEELDPHYKVSVTSWTGESRRWHDSHWDPYITPYVQVDNNHMTHNYLTHPNCWAVCPSAIAYPMVQRNPSALTIRRLASAPPKHVCYLVVARAHIHHKPEMLHRLYRSILSYAESSHYLIPIYNEPVGF